MARQAWKWKPSSKSDPTERFVVVDGYQFRIWKNAQGERGDGPEWGACCDGRILTEMAYSMTDAKRVCRIEYDRLITKGALP